MIRIGDIIEGVIMMNSSGSAYLVSDVLEDDLFIFKTKTNESFHSDKVKVKVIYGHKRKYEGEVIEILERNKVEFVGVIQKTSKTCFFIPDNGKIKIDFYIPTDKTNKAKDGQKVVVRFTEWGRGKKNPNGEVIRILGEVGNCDTEMHAILEEYGLPYEFPENVLVESDLISSEIPQSEIDKRLDMRDVLTFTIDGETAKDLDDALSIRWINDEVEIGIHIADVSFYVKPNTSIFEEAYNRGTSIYLVDRTIPMLPPKLSNDLCSLNPNTDKLVYSFIFTFDNNGKIVNQKFNKGIINSNYRLTYTEVQKVIEGGETHSDELKHSILSLDRYAKILNKMRSKNNHLSFRGNEIKFKLDENNKPIGVLFNVQTDSNHLIEEFMVLTNKKVCEFIASKNVKSIHRVHDKPDISKLESLKNFVSVFGYEIKLNDEDKIKNELNKLLTDSLGTSEENIISNFVVRCMSKAKYQTENIGHYGLGIEHYVHVTSPIRRMCDLLIHTQLNSMLTNGGYL